MNKDFINNRIECCECNKFLLIEDRISDGDYPYNYLKYSDQVYLKNHFSSKTWYIP